LAALLCPVNGVAGDFQQVIRIDSDFFQCFPAFSRIFLMLSTVLPLGFSIITMTVFGLLLLAVFPGPGPLRHRLTFAAHCRAFSFSTIFNHYFSGDYHRLSIGFPVA